MGEPSIGSRDKTVHDVCRLAADFYSGKDVSEVELIRASGYRELRQVVTVSDIAACLRQHPDWERAWVMLSADQRVDQGWYVLERDGKCVVGSFPGGRETTFDDCTLACSDFVKRHAEELADWTARGMLRQTAGWFADQFRDEFRRRRQRP